MKGEIASNFFIVNQDPHSTEDLDIFNKIGNLAIYEVVKVVDEVPLFFEEHMERIQHSAHSLGVRIQETENEIREGICLLVKKNAQKNGNVKLISAQGEGNSLFFTYFLRSEYPNNDAFTHGIRTILYKGERNTPHTKTVNVRFREMVTAARKKARAYEALLVNNDGYITEGSRSNIFFLKNAKLYTPSAETVLLGVTRKHVMQICQTLGIEVNEQRLHHDELTTIEGAFITGTTVDVLPIGSIDTTKINSVSHAVIKRIVETYDEEVRVYIRQHRDHCAVVS